MNQHDENKSQRSRPGGAKSQDSRTSQNERIHQGAYGDVSSRDDNMDASTGVDGVATDEGVSGATSSVNFNKGEWPPGSNDPDEENEYKFFARARKYEIPMSDTPKTDTQMESPNEQTVPIDFARQLERELAAVTKERDEAKQQWREDFETRTHLLAERDEADRRAGAAERKLVGYEERSAANYERGKAWLAERGFANMTVSLALEMTLQDRDELRRQLAAESDVSEARGDMLYDYQEKTRAAQMESVSLAKQLTEAFNQHPGENPNYVSVLKVYLDRIKRDLAEAQADTERVDWLIQFTIDGGLISEPRGDEGWQLGQNIGPAYLIVSEGATLRCAIDSAIKNEPAKS